VELTLLNQVGAFRTTVKRISSFHPNYLVLPKLLPLDDLECFVDLELDRIEELQEHPLFITNYALYDETKHRCFVKWLEENYENCMISEDKEDKSSSVDFVSFNGRISDSLQTPLVRQCDGWEIFAMNIGGVIYLWDEKVMRSGPPISKAGYGGLAFEQLVTKQCPESASPRMDMDKLSLNYIN